MRYRLGIEQMEDEHWIAWVFELPGCYSSGTTRVEAIGNAGAAISAYRLWIARHRGESMLDDPYMDIHVAEVYQSSKTAPDTITNAFFEEDRLFLDDEEIALGLELLNYTRADLLALVNDITPERRSAAISDHPEGSINGTVRHLATEEWWYLERLGMAFPKKQLPKDTFKCLDKVRTYLREVVSTWAEDDRVVTLDGETWSCRKVLRRALWHERDHTQQIAKIITA